jgi:hypothetical protein
VNLDELMDECEPDPRPLVAPRARALDAMKAFEQARKVLGCYPDARVLDHEESFPIDARRSDRDGALEGELERVRQEIEDDLFPHAPVDEDVLAATAGNPRRIRDQLARSWI